MSPEDFVAHFFEQSPLPGALRQPLGGASFFIRRIEESIQDIHFPKEGLRLTHYEVFLFTSGHCTLFYNLNEIHQQAGQIRFSAPGALSRIQAIAPEVRGYYLFFDDAFIQLASQTNIVAQLPFFFFNNHPILHPAPVVLEGWCALCEHLIRLSAAPNDPAQSKIISTYLVAFLLECKALFKEAPSSKTEGTAAARITRQFFEALLNDLSYNNKVQEIATSIGISPKHLTKSIKHTTGFPPTHFIKKALSLEAQILLQETDDSISEIAYTLGFEDVSYFIRFFKKNTQQTPAAYRSLAQS